MKSDFVTQNKQVAQNGFALIVTIALLVMLSLIALGFLSLSAVTLRGSSQSQAMEEARANARMALQVAIGELQKQTGSDTRVTAMSTIKHPNSPPILGAWRSWEGMDHEGKKGSAPGRPIAALNYRLKEVPFAENDGRFLSWLISTARPRENLSDPSSLAFTAPVFIEGKKISVPLLAEGSLGSNPGQIHVIPNFIENESGSGGGRSLGASAWWVSPENQKARLVQPYESRSNDAGGWVESGQSHSVPNPGVFGLDDLIEDREEYTPGGDGTKPANRAVTLGSTKLIANDDAQPQFRFHDLSTSAVGLLTNTATGGWRKDLSILTEKWDEVYASFPGGTLPLFRYSPAKGDTSQVPKPTESNYDPEQCNFYPWSEYSLILGFLQPSTYHAASASWASLQSFATAYKNFSYDSGQVSSPFVWDKIAKNDSSSIRTSEIYNHKHRMRIHPQIARFQFLVYATAVEDPGKVGQTPKRYQIRLLYVPFFTLWNPYNFALEHRISGTLSAGQGSGQHPNFLGFGWKRSLPGAMAIVDRSKYPNPGDVPSGSYRLLSRGNFYTLDWPKNYATPYDKELEGNTAKYNKGREWKDSRNWGCWLPEGPLTFGPGEAKIFSPDFSDPGYGFGGTAFRMKEGYSPDTLVGTVVDFKPVTNQFSNLTVERSFWFLFRNDRLTQPYRDRQPGYGFSLSFGNGHSHFGGTSQVPSTIGEEFHNITSLASIGEGEAYWPEEEVDEVGYSVGEIEGQWIPIYSISFGPRMTIGAGSGTKQNRPTRGVVQNNALASMVLSDPGSGDPKDHPANNTFDFAYQSLPIGSTVTPNLTESEGFIATGHQRGDGLTRLVMANVPLRPMASLLELEGWNPRGHNPYPPLHMNLIGNSDATPLLPDDSVVPRVLKPSGDKFNLMHDDAYCANHLLVDDWFVSSIAPNPGILGGAIGKEIETVYREFLSGESYLSNRSYRVASEQGDPTSSQANDLVNEILNSPDGWMKIAAQIEVHGMFNVNSVSVDAWAALLGHGKSRENIALFGAGHIKPVAPSNGHAITRGAVAPDVEAGSGPAIGGAAPNASEFTGFRSLSDDQILDLAEKIVEQVRARGPFLSLSEFMNRQLSGDTSLSMAGAVQTAINNMEEDPMAILRNPANMLSDDTMYTTNPDDDKLKGVSYEFPAAAEGSSAYGVPGWIRQADVLRPIAPVLSVRDDTFTIRAYGDSRDELGQVVASVWCEAVVKRVPEFCDTADVADSIEAPVSVISVDYGRRYKIVSFRWLSEEEV